MHLSDDQTWHIHHGDCIPYMLNEMEPASVDFSVFSPPYPAVYSYSSLACDIGNSEDLKGEAKLHFGYMFRGLRRVMKPGRAIAMHCTNIVRYKRSGGEGLFDFRGMLIRLAERAGLVYEYDWTIRKNPQAQAIRTRSHQLQFAGMESDRAGSRGALPDYIIKFRAPGVNDVPVNSVGDVSRNDWIAWAECAWLDIKETDTLNVKDGRGDEDVKHIFALQLGLIRRLVKLYTNPGEVVFSPFAGIGSELYSALLLDRKGHGCEIKDEYFAAAQKNCERAVASRCEQGALFA